MTKDLREQRFIEGVLRNLRLFAQVAREEVASITRRCWVLEARRGDRLVRTGERPPGVLVVGYGLVKLVIPAPAKRERVWRIVSAGECFGAASALLGRATRYEACAVADVKLVVLPTAPLCGLVEREPRFGLGLAQLLAEQTIALLSELTAASVMRSNERLASYLHSLAAPVQGNGGWIVRLPVSKTLLAARLGMKKETLSRGLRRLSRQGLIEVTQREIAILDREALARLTDGHRDRM